MSCPVRLDNWPKNSELEGEFRLVSRFWNGLSEVKFGL